MDAAGYPLVQLDRSVSGARAAAVLVDNYRSACSATGYLLAHGHRVIAHFAGTENTQSACDRQRGFLDTMSACSGARAVLVPGDFTIESGVRQFETLRLSADRPTAVFAASDLQAVGILHAAAAAGWKVPEDISIVGHDDIPIAAMINPALTTMAQPKYQLGEVAVDTLLQKLLDKDSGDSGATLSTELVERATVRDVRFLNIS